MIFSEILRFATNFKRRIYGRSRKTDYQFMSPETKRFSVRRVTAFMVNKIDI